MDKNRLSQLVDTGMTLREIASAGNVSYTTVRYWMKVYGLSPQHRVKAKMNRRCARCGESDRSKFYRSVGSLCGKCENEDAMKRQKETRKRIVDYLGGKCVICGYDKYIVALDPHHLNPKEKDVIEFRISNGTSAISKVGLMHKCTTTANLANETDDV